MFPAPSYILNLETAFAAVSLHLTNGCRSQWFLCDLNFFCSIARAIPLYWQDMSRSLCNQILHRMIISCIQPLHVDIIKIQPAVCSIFYFVIVAIIKLFVGLIAKHNSNKFNSTNWNRLIYEKKCQALNELSFIHNNIDASLRRSISENTMRNVSVNCPHMRQKCYLVLIGMKFNSLLYLNSLLFPVLI